MYLQFFLAHLRYDGNGDSFQATLIWFMENSRRRRWVCQKPISSADTPPVAYDPLDPQWSLLLPDGRMRARAERDRHRSWVPAGSNTSRLIHYLMLSADRTTARPRFSLVGPSLCTDILLHSPPPPQRILPRQSKETAHALVSWKKLVVFDRKCGMDLWLYDSAVYCCCKLEEIQSKTNTIVKEKATSKMLTKIYIIIICDVYRILYECQKSLS